MLSSADVDAERSGPEDTDGPRAADGAWVAGHSAAGVVAAVLCPSNEDAPRLEQETRAEMLAVPWTVVVAEEVLAGARSQAPPRTPSSRHRRWVTRSVDDWRERAATPIWPDIRCVPPRRTEPTRCGHPATPTAILGAEQADAEPPARTVKSVRDASLADGTPETRAAVHPCATGGAPIFDLIGQ